METQSFFSYNLPSIPGKTIRLRVKPVSKKGFSSNLTKHSENYTDLTDSFIS